MKFSKETLAVLKNFSAINGNILFKQGNKITTLSPAEDIYAVAEIGETIPTEFGIYDLSKFLNAVSLFKDPDLCFDDDNFLTIRGGNQSSLRYVFCEPHILVTPPDNLQDDLPDMDEWFDLPQGTIEAVTKAASTLGIKDVCLISDGVSVSLVAIDINNPSSDKYSVEVGESTTEFSINFPVEVLKLLPGSYRVGISSTGSTNWVNTNYPIQYWIASSTTSRYG